jgi:hypothetical protein
MSSVADNGTVGETFLTGQRTGTDVHTVAIAADLLQLTGSTGLQLNGISMNPGTGSYTGSFTGFTSTPTSTVRWVKFGAMVSISIDAFTGTSNAITMTENSGLMPVEIRPARIQGCPMLVVNSGGRTTGYAEVQTNGTIIFRGGSFQSVFSSSGVKGVGDTGGTGVGVSTGTCTYITL